MNYIYPKFNTTTHRVVTSRNLVGISKDYPSNSSFSRKKDYIIKAGTAVAVIEENVGYKCLWAFVKETENVGTQLSYYILQENLQNVGGKQTYTPIKTAQNMPNINALEIDPYTKEIFVPYIDSRNGLYSVRIQTDYEKILDSFVFENLLYDVFYEGVSVLLESRGFKSDNAYIDELINKYYTFAYINDDLAETVNRPCEPITFTVSIPLRFFNEQPQASNEEPKVADRVLILENFSLENTINKLIAVFTSRSNEIINLTYPNQFIENFIVDETILSIKKFSVAASELFDIAGFPILPKSSNKTYEIGLSNNFDLVYIKITADGKQIYLPRAVLSQFRLRAEFNSKRIFFYLINLDKMIEEIRSPDIKEFIFKYVKYPSPTIKKSDLNIAGQKFSPEEVKKYQVEFDKAAAECLNYSDFSGIIDKTTRFTLWAMARNKTQVSEKVEDRTAEASTKKDVIEAGDAGSTSGPISQIASGIAEQLETDVDKYRAHINTLLYGLHRINFSSILLKKLICNLKGLNPNSKEVSEIISVLPQELLNYFNYLAAVDGVSPTGLTGWDYVEALERGVAPDFKIYCASNSGLIYFVKALSKITSALNVVAAPALDIIQPIKAFSLKENNSKKISPWKIFGKAFITAFEQQTIQLAFDLIAESLRVSCDDPSQGNSNNSVFADPFNSTVPSNRFNGTKENNNPNQIKRNRREILDKVFLNELQFGFDREYTVDLIGKLLNDINCILTPQESAQLLRNNPSTVAITLIKNIIRAKYSKPPNDLTFLLNDIKLIEFFRQLGETVDTDILEQIDKAINNTGNPLTPSQICSPQQLKAREDFFNNKLPPELGILEKQQQIRSRNAKKIFDKIKQGSQQISINALCEDLENSEILAAKEVFLQTIKTNTYSTFASTLTDFDNEAFNIPKIFREEKGLYRYDADGDLFDTVAYYTYNSNLVNNLSYTYTVQDYSARFNEELSEENCTGYKIKYFFLAQEKDLADISNLLLPSDQDEKTLKFVCNNSSEQFDTDFLKFIANDNLIVEFAEFDFIFDGEGGTEGSDLQEFKLQTDVRDSKLGIFLNSKKYFVTISVNREIGNNVIEFKLIYNDSLNNKFRILDKYVYEADPDAEKLSKGDLLGLGSDAFTEGFEYFLKNFGYTEEYDETNIKSSPSYDSKIIALQEDDDVYLVSPYYFSNIGYPNQDQAGPTRKLIEAIYLEKFKKKIEDIEKFLKTQELVEKFQNTGIFQSEMLFFNDSNKVIKKINIGHGSYNQNTKEPDYILVNYAKTPVLTNNLPKFSEPGQKPSQEIQKAILSVYEYLKNYPSQDNDNNLNKDTILVVDSDSTQPLQKILLNDLKENYVEPAIDALDNYVSEENIDELFEIVKKLKFLVIQETGEPAAYAFDRLYTEIEFGNEDFLTVLSDVGVESFEPEYRKKTKSIIDIYLSSLTSGEATIEQIQNYVDVVVDILDGVILNSSINQMYTIIQKLSRQTYKGKPALEKFIELYSIDENGDQFIDDLTTNKENFEDPPYKAKYDTIVGLVRQLSLDQYTEEGLTKHLYYKSGWNIKEFIFSLKEGKSDFLEDSNIEKITDADYNMNLADSSSDIRQASYSKIANLKYPKDQRYINCNIQPHYLNLEYLIQKELSNVSNKLCDINGYTPYDILKSILVQLTFRVHITDLLVKSIPYLATLPFEKLINFYNNEFVVNIIKEFMKREFKVFSPGSKDINILETVYSKYFFKITKEVYKSHEESGTLKNKFINEQSSEKEIDYFIKREINRFINYSFEFDVFRPNEGRTFENFINEKIGDENAKEFAILEYDTAICYFMAANTVELDKRSIFYASKSDLASIFFNLIGQLTEVEESDSNIETFNRSQEDVMDFLTKISYSASPASMVFLRPEYSKYVKKYLLWLLDFTTKTLGTIAEQSSKNIQLTKLISRATVLISTGVWSLLDSQTRTSLIAKDASLFSMRIDQGKPLLPESVVSVGLFVGSGLNPLMNPGQIGWAFDAFDAIGETIWYYNAVMEYLRLQGQKPQNDPCQIPQENKDKAINSTECTLETNEELMKEIKSLEGDI